MTDNLRRLYNVATNVAAASEPVLHVRMQGRSRDITLSMLGITGSWTDDEIKSAVAQFMELPSGAFTSTVIERHSNGNLTLRPEAVFG